MSVGAEPVEINPRKHLFENISIDKDVTIRDIVMVIKRYDLYDLMPMPWVSEVVEEIINTPENNPSGNVVVYWHLHRTSHSLFGNDFVSVDGADLVYSEIYEIAYLPVVTGDMIIENDQRDRIIIHNPHYKIMDIIYGLVSCIGGPLSYRRFIKRELYTEEE